MKRFYVIYNPTTEDLKKVYGSETMPALYVTYPLAAAILKVLKLRGELEGYEVREVEVTIL